MRNGVVSVVLPIYNVEQYLERCIKSIVDQTYENLEIILVDDGSPDRCPEICEEWAKRDGRIKVVHKENAGLGMARNTGIENATGDYICFFDSDDYVALDTIEKAYRLAADEKSDIVLFGLSDVDASGAVVRSHIPQADKVTYCDGEVQSRFLPNLIAAKPTDTIKNIRMSACTCMFSVDLIQKSEWRFASERDIISEDVYSLLCLYKHVRKVSIISEALYFYCENGTSLTHVYREDRFEKICHFHRLCEEKAQELGYDAEVIQRLQGPLASFAIAAMKQIVRAELTEKEKYDAIREIVCSDYLRSIRWDYSLHSDSRPRRIFLYLLEKRWTLPCCLILKNWQK